MSDKIIHINFNDYDVQIPEIPYCGNCPYIPKSDDYNRCCYNRLYWSDKFKSIKIDTENE